MSILSAWLVDVPPAIGHFFSVAEYFLFQLFLFACFALVLARLFLDEWRKK